MLTMHTVGGTAMMEAGQRGAEEGAAEYGGDVPATLGITVLTSMSPEALAATGVARPLPESRWRPSAAQAKEAGHLRRGGLAPRGALPCARSWGPAPSSSLPACARPAPPWETRAAWQRPHEPSRDGAFPHRGGPAHHRGARSCGGLRGHRRGTGVAPKRFIPE
ncbi:MAG: hypothetical protein ACLTDR_07260 [Adlercreutzia equolifaciens]